MLDKLRILLVLIPISLLLLCSTSLVWSIERAPQLLIFDFYNMSNNTEYDNLSPQFSERLKQKLSLYFSVYDTTYVRDYTNKQGYTTADLYNTDNARKIGEEIGVDYILRGAYNFFGDEVQVLLNFTPMLTNQPTYPYEYVLDRDSIFSDLNDMVEDTYEDIIGQIPRVQVATEEELAASIEEKATSEITIEMIISTYLQNSDLDVGTPHTLDPDDIIFENPSPRPEWTISIPTSAEKIYFIGQSFDMQEYNTALEKAIEDAHLQVAMSIGTQVEYSFEEISQSADRNLQRDVKSSLLLNVLNNVRNLKREGIYFLKTTENNYHISVLYCISRIDFERLIRESINQERMQAEAQIAQAQNQEEIAQLTNRIEAYEMLLREQQSIINNVRQERMRYEYHNPTPQEIARAEELSRQGEEIEMVTETQSEWSTLDYWGWSLNGVGIGFYGVAALLEGLASADEVDIININDDVATKLGLSGMVFQITGSILMITGELLTWSPAIGWTNLGIGLGFIGLNSLFIIHEKYAPVIAFSVSGTILAITGLIIGLVSDYEEEEVQEAMYINKEPINPYFDHSTPMIGISPQADGAMATMLMRF
jgi:TolB-like protein